MLVVSELSLQLLVVCRYVEEGMQQVYMQETYINYISQNEFKIDCLFDAVHCNIGLFLFLGGPNIPAIVTPTIIIGILLCVIINVVICCGLRYKYNQG